MIQHVDVADQPSLEEYASVANLAGAVREFTAEVRPIVERLAGHTVWMVSSTAQGGGVAEMLPTIVGILRELGVRTEWVVIGADDPRFFTLTKQLHNMLHGVGPDALPDDARAVYEAVNQANAEALRPLVRPGDLLVVHDPQPLPIAAMLGADGDVLALWRCHIGLDRETPQTRAAWAFLDPYLAPYRRAIFSAPEYIPPALAGRSTVIYPGLDPLAAKNRELSFRNVVEVLCTAGLIPCPGPTVDPPFAALAERLLPDGRFAPANATEDIGLLTRPIVLQVSRWDRLKGFRPLLDAFATLKRTLYDDRARAPQHERRLDLLRLVLAGPEPAAIQDDPEARAVLDELIGAYRALPAVVQDDVALLALPMQSREQNALMVNALQRASTIVVQNSLREGFGLTITEAMWKRLPVLSNRRACGPRQQLRDGLDGRLVDDPEDRDALCAALDAMLAAPDDRERWGRTAQRRVHDQFLVFRQLQAWGRLLGELV